MLNQFSILKLNFNFPCYTHRLYIVSKIHRYQIEERNKFENFAVNAQDIFLRFQRPLNSI